MTECEQFMRYVADKILEDEVRWTDEQVMCLSDMLQRMSDYLNIEAEDLEDE